MILLQKLHLLGFESSELIRAVKEANEDFELVLIVPGVRDTLSRIDSDKRLEGLLEENARLRKENKELLAKVMQLIDLLDKK